MIETVKKGQGSIEVVTGVQEHLRLNEIGGAVLFNVKGVAGSIVDPTQDPFATTVVSRDALKYDVRDWWAQQLDPDNQPPIDELVPISLKLMSLEDTIRAHILDIKTKRTNTAAGHTLLQAIHGLGQELIAQIPLEERDGLVDENGVSITDYGRLNDELLGFGDRLAKTETHEADELTEEVAALETERDTIKADNPEAADKLIQPLRTLIRYKLFTPGESLEDLAHTIRFSSLPQSKAGISLPQAYNGITLPLSHQSALALVERAITESESTSVFRRN